MNDNSTTEALIMEYIDGKMNQEDRDSFELRLSNDAGLARQVSDLQDVRDAVKRYGLKQKVSSIRKEMLQNEQASRGILRNISRNTLRAAASIIIIFISIAAYQYFTLSPDLLYNEKFHVYSFSENRGSHESSALQLAYRENKMDDVISIFNHETEHTAEDYFLAGNAYLQSGNSREAISVFHSLLEQNKTQNTQRFQEDAEYYLALSYLSNHELKRAIPLFEKIHAEKTHAYNDKVSAWFLQKLHWTDK